MFAALETVFTVSFLTAKCIQQKGKVPEIVVLFACVLYFLCVGIVENADFLVPGEQPCSGSLVLSGAYSLTPIICIVRTVTGCDQENTNTEKSVHAFCVCSLWQPWSALWEAARSADLNI